MSSDGKTDETIELERVVMTVLWANPTVPSYEEFRRLFTDYLTSRWFYDEFRLELALRKLDRGDLAFPSSGLLFTPPSASPPPRR